MDTLWNRRKKKKERNYRKKEFNSRLIKDRIIRDIRTLFEQQEEDHYKPKRLINLWNNGDKNRNLSLDTYLNKIEPYLIIDLQNSDTW